MIEITDDQWAEQYRPLPNHQNQDYDFDYGNGCCLYETFGEDLAYIHSLVQQGSHCVWTVVECDGDFYISEGLHHVNRIGYIVTEKPYQPNQIYNILVD